MFSQNDSWTVHYALWLQVTNGELLQSRMQNELVWTLLRHLKNLFILQSWLLLNTCKTIPGLIEGWVIVAAQ